MENNTENKNAPAGKFVPVRVFLVGLYWDQEKKTHTVKAVSVQKPIWLSEEEASRLKFERSIMFEIQGYLP
jgi:hypothetical protein